MLSSTLSKAAVRSRRPRTAELLESTVNGRLFKFLKSAVSVLWHDLKSDWNFSEMPFRSLKDCRCSLTTFSKTLERKKKKLGNRLKVG